MRFETERLAIVEMNVRNAGCAHDAEVLFLRLRVEEPRNELFQNLLPDVAREVPAHQRRGRFARTEPGQLRPVLKRLRDLDGLGLDCLGGNRDLKLVLTTFH